ncbi:MAG: hypothetical protein V1926_02105 [Candidatus Peregrinibacteria bacterium]
MMHVRYIYLSPHFLKRWNALSGEMQHRSQKAIDLFRGNPFHPSLRLHRLKGKMRMYWSISIDRGNRIVFRLDGDKAYFSSIGSHAIYEQP